MTTLPAPLATRTATRPADAPSPATHPAAAPSPSALAGPGPLLALTLPTPAGDLSVLVADGVVRASGFAPLDATAARLPADLGLRGYAVVGPDEQDGGVSAVAQAVARYADGELTALDAVPAEQGGGPFQQRAWRAMRSVAPGTTVTYADIAVAAGSPAAVRAAGSACARNLVAPFVPCHRVLRTGGSMGGYLFGLDVKRALLRHESRA